MTTDVAKNRKASPPVFGILTKSSSRNAGVACDVQGCYSNVGYFVNAKVNCGMGENKLINSNNK